MGFAVSFRSHVLRNKKEGGCGKIAAAFVCNEIETLHCFEDLAYAATGDEVPAVTKRFASKAV